ncbi:MAG: ATP-binding protein [Phormidium sp.]
MNQHHSRVPRLDLAPKLRRPLSLLNPLDYLRLLYWVFFFPQALGWYLDEEQPKRKSIPKGQITWQQTWEWLRKNQKARQLILQSLVLTVLTWLFLCGILQKLGNSIEGLLITQTALFIVYLSLLIGFIGTWLIGQKYGITLAVASGVASGTISGILYAPLYLYLTLDSTITSLLSSVFRFFKLVVVNQTIDTLAVSVKYGILLGIVFALAWGAALGVVSGVAFGLRRSFLEFSLLSTLLNFIWSLIKYGLALEFFYLEILSILCFGLCFFLASNVAILRIEAWILSLLFSLKSSSNGCWLIFNVTPIPIPFLSARLKKWLRQDWESGLHNANELLKYSLQFYIVTNAINELILTIKEEDKLIFRISQLTEAPYDWRLVDWLSDKLRKEAEIYNFDDLQSTSSITTNAAIAITGFNDLYMAAELKEDSRTIRRKPLHNAVKVFKIVRSLPYGEEVFILTRTLATLADASELASIASLQMPTFPKQTFLRLATWEVIADLYKVIENARVIQRIIFRSVRTSALNEALEILKNIQDKLKILPEAERALIGYIVQTWEATFLKVANELGEIFIKETVRNPYVLISPVQGKLFVGRENILRQLEELWILSERPNSVVLYGHRRMGKTSILNNVANHLGAVLQVAYINLQTYNFQGVGEMLIAISDAISSTVKILPPADADLLNLPQATFIRYLKRIEANLGEKALIIVMDEFEVIEESIKRGTLDKNFTGFLRGLMQMSPKIAFLFAGLHTLEEMTEDYFQPFFASVIPIRVSFLTPKATCKLLEEPSEEFPLRYTPETLNKIYNLTAGQPYIIQLLGSQLVHRYNDQVFEQEIYRDPIFTTEDLEAVIDDPKLFSLGRYYFTGVWGQAAQGASGQQTILRSIAPHPEGLSIDAIAQATNLDETTIQEALKTLKRHDVVKEIEGRWQIIVELFRRWVVNL